MRTAAIFAVTCALLAVATARELDFPGDSTKEELIPSRKTSGGSVNPYGERRKDVFQPQYGYAPPSGYVNPSKEDTREELEPTGNYGTSTEAETKEEPPTDLPEGTDTPIDEGLKDDFQPHYGYAPPKGYIPPTEEVTKEESKPLEYHPPEIEEPKSETPKWIQKLKEFFKKLG